ncbi:hypothetical protein TKK_0015271 [Trichogramma kaykai]
MKRKINFADLNTSNLERTSVNVENNSPIQPNLIFLEENLPNYVEPPLPQSISNENMMEVSENITVDSCSNSRTPSASLRTALNEKVENNAMEISEDIDVNSYSNFKRLMQQY